MYKRNIKPNKIKTYEKDSLSFFGFGPFLLAGAASWAQGPVSTYKLEASATAPARPEQWTDFELGTDAGYVNVSGYWLSTAAAPLKIDTTTPVSGISLGFSLPFEDKQMNFFGVSGDGLVYFFEGEDDTVGYSRNTTVGINMSSGYVKNAVCAAPAIWEPSYFYSYPLSIQADTETRIGYNLDEANGVLTVRFENVLAWWEQMSWTGFDPATAMRCSYDIVATEEGGISVHFWAAELPDMTPIENLYYGYPLDLAFKFALKGETEYTHALDWDGSTDFNAGVILMDAEHVAQTPVLTFFFPVPCTVPTGVTASLETLSQRSDSFSGKVKAEGAYDGLLVLLSTTETIAGRPEDQTVYETAPTVNIPADTVGGCPVVSVGDGVVNLFNVNEPAGMVGQKAPGTKLDPGTEYFLMVFPYNDACEGGPVYATEPIVLPFRTAHMPVEVEVADIESDAVEFAISGHEGLDILVGYSRQQYYDYDYALDFAQRVYEKGDTIFFSAEPVSDHNDPYLMQAAYSGPVSDGKLRIEGLEAGVPYYFYFWIETAEGQHASQYAYQGIYTMPVLRDDTSLVFNFMNDAVPGDPEANDAKPDTVWPAGWSTSLPEAAFMPKYPSFYVDNENVLPDDLDAYRSATVYLRNTDGFYVGDMISPVIETKGSALVLTAKIQLADEMRGLALSPTESLGEDDTLSVWYKGETETEWTLAEYLTDAELVYPEGEDFATVRFNVPAADLDRIQLRFLLKVDYSMGDPRFCLNELVVDPALPCAFPIDFAVIDSLTTHRTLVMEWTDQNSPRASSFIYQYREAGAEEWSEIANTNAASCTIEGLVPNTLYEVGVRAVCAMKDTSLLKTGEGYTMIGMPYEQALTDMQELPRGYEIESDYFGGWTTEVRTSDGHTLLGATSSAYGSDPMMKFPPIYLEELAAPAEFTFQCRAFYASYSGAEPKAIGDSSSAWIVVYLSDDKEFSDEEAVDTIRLADCDMNWEPYAIDLSDWTKQLYVALAIQDTGEYYEYRAGCCFFAIDSIEARYTDYIPCMPVENIQQYDLTTRGVTLSWEGYSTEYGIYFTNQTSGETDTVYTMDNVYTFDTLSPGTMYTYFIQPFCEEGHRSPGALSEEGFFTTVDICAMPANFRIVSTTWRSVIFAAEAEGTKYVHIWEAKPSEFPDIYMLLSTSDTIEVLGLDYQTDYFISLRAICGAGDSSVWTDTLFFTTLLPECNAPANLDAEEGSTSADLSWTGDDNHSYYWLYYRPTAVSSFADTLEVYQTYYTLENLEPNTAYVWTLRAICDDTWISEPAVMEFTTEDVANEAGALAGLKVGAQNRRIAIWNESGIWIDRVDVLSVGGMLLYSTEVMASDHVLLPELNQGGLVLVRIVSGQDMATYKVVLVR